MFGRIFTRSYADSILHPDPFALSRFAIEDPQFTPDNPEEVDQINERSECASTNAENSRTCFTTILFAGASVLVYLVKISIQCFVLWTVAFLLCNWEQITCTLDARVGLPFDVSRLCGSQAFNTEIGTLLPRIEVLEQIVESLDVTPFSAMHIRFPHLNHTLLLRRNFALRGDGGRAIPALTSPTHNLLPHTLLSYIATSLGGIDKRSLHIHPPTIILEGDLRIGNCWEFLGSRGHVGIALSERIVVSGVTVSHVSPQLISTNSSLRAPRDMALWGLVSSEVVEHLKKSGEEVFSVPPSRFISPRFPSPPVRDSDVFLRIADFRYNVHAAALRQAFPIAGYVGAHRIAFGTVVLQVLSNRGSNTTCLYPVEIHGDSEVHEDGV